MDYYGLLFLYYLKGLSGKSVLKLFFNIEAGGTEQLLPENTSTPTTTPILADIQYPDGLRTDQYFTYRETPTTVSNKARIKTIKGNTLVWNQLFEPLSNGSLTINGVTITRQDGKYTLSGTAMDNGGRTRRWNNSNISLKSNHKYLLLSPVNLSISDASTNAYIGQFDAGVIKNFELDADVYLGMNTINGTTYNQSGYVNLFDLTAMGLDSLTDTEIYQWFANYFPLSYYSYNQGSLLSFNGNGIKTVGKNLFDFSQFANGTITFENGVLTGTASQFYTVYDNVVNNGIDLKYPKNTQITISFDARTEQNYSPEGGGLYLVASENGIRVQLATTTNNTTAIQHKTVTIPSNRHIDKLGWTYGSNPSNIWHITNFQVEFGIETDYEPYTSSTLSLPISTYFPTGMKSAGNVYDELTPTKATTRIGVIDLGSLTWRYGANLQYFYANISNMKSGTDNAVCPLYENSHATTITTVGNMQFMIYENEIRIKNSAYTDATAFKTAMSGVYLFYEMVNETETPITTEDANEALSLLMGKSVSSNNANQLINIITKGE